MGWVYSPIVFLSRSRFRRVRRSRAVSARLGMRQRRPNTVNRARAQAAKQSRTHGGKQPIALARRQSISNAHTGASGHATKQARRFGHRFHRQGMHFRTILVGTTWCLRRSRHCPGSAAPHFFRILRMPPLNTSLLMRSCKPLSA